MAKPSSNVGRFEGAESKGKGSFGLRIDTPKESRKSETKLMAQSKKASVPK